MNISKIANFVVDCVFPKRCIWCDEVVGFLPTCSCANAKSSIALPARQIDDFSINPWHLKEVYAVYRYEFPVRDAILRFKFEGQDQLKTTFAQEMARHFALCGLNGKFDAVVPAPVSAKTLKKRGYNQSALLAQIIGEKVGIAHRDDLLKKTRETKQQRTLQRAQRLTNLKNAYEASPQAAKQRILIIDDIVTTASTINECAAALKKAGAQTCSALCLAATKL